MEEYAIRVKKIKSGYGQSNILFGVDFEAIKKGITAAWILFKFSSPIWRFFL